MYLLYIHCTCTGTYCTCIVHVHVLTAHTCTCMYFMILFCSSFICFSQSLLLRLTSLGLRRAIAPKRLVEPEDDEVDNDIEHTDANMFLAQVAGKTNPFIYLTHSLLQILIF